MARRANPSIAPTSRRPRMHIFGIHNPALQRLHPLLNYLLNPLRMRFIRWQRAHIIAPIRRAVKTREQVSRHPAHARHSVAERAHHRPTPARAENERSGLAPSLAPASPDAPDIPPTSSTAPNSASRDRPRKG